MALALDGTPQSATGTMGAGLTQTFTFSTTQANDIIIVGSASNGAGITGVTGPGLTFARRAQYTTHQIEEWYAVAASVLTNASIVITYAAGENGNYYANAVFAISGADTSTIWDSNADIPLTGGAAADPSISTTNADTFIYGILRTGTGTTTAGAGWTAINNTTGAFFVIEYKIVSAAQTNLVVALGTGTGTENGYVVDAVIQAGGSCANSGETSTGTSATPNGTTGSYVGNAGAFVTPNCSSTQYFQPSGGKFGTSYFLPPLAALGWILERRRKLKGK